MDQLVENINKQIARIAKGDQTALGKLYELCGGYLLFMAKKYLYDKSYAEDIVSEVFLKVVKNAQDFDTAQNGLNWLFKITRNTALNFNQKENRYPTEDIEVHRDLADVLSFSPEESADFSRLRDRIAALPKEERELLYYRYWEGYTVRELAQKTGKATMTLHDKLKRILKSLKKDL
ncbi:MAG: sigma-70 family RNA polymerase sigma factor [Candidatus Moranbacteria bacterium]|nr:sigma-70 family RNA polymerase sigma factor [Candidatus Moranbacteria bacterium]